MNYLQSLRSFMSICFKALSKKILSSKTLREGGTKVPLVPFPQNMVGTCPPTKLGPWSQPQLYSIVLVIDDQNNDLMSSNEICFFTLLFGIFLEANIEILWDFSPVRDMLPQALDLHWTLIYFRKNAHHCRLKRHHSNIDFDIPLNFCPKIGHQY